MASPAAASLEQASKAAKHGNAWNALCCLRDALEASTALADGWLRAIEVARSIGDETGAVQAAQRLVLETQDRDAARFVLAETLTEAGRAAEAVELLRPAAEAERLSERQQFGYSRMLMISGRLSEAQQCARRLLSKHGDNPMLWERIAQTKKFVPGDPDIATMDRLFTRSDPAKAASHAALSGALAKACVDIGEDRGADRYLRAKAEANARRFAFDASLLEQAVADIESWCADGGPESGSRGAESDRPIFILGPARSGTSLLDQIICCHPQVGGGGELRHFWLCSRELGDCSSAGIAAFDANTGSAGLWNIIGTRYLALANERFGDASRFTDKLLSNVYRVRAIRRALPRAKILYLRRNPLDIAWSCWRAQFDADSAWSVSPQGIALYIAAYGRAMRAWSRRYPETISEVSYEELVSRPGEVIPGVLQSCGLTDHAATRHPERSSRSVATLSFARVREPIGTSSIDAARRFPLATAPLRGALEQLGIGIETITDGETGRLNDAD